MEGALREILDSYMGATDLKALLKAVRDFKAQDGFHAGAMAGFPLCNIWILSNYSTGFIASALPLALACKSVRAEVSEAGYNQWEEVLHNENHPATGPDTDFILLLLGSVELAFRGSMSPESLAARIAGAVMVAMKRSSARFVITLPEPLEEETSCFSWAYNWRARLCSLLRERLEKAGAIFLDMEPLIRRAGHSAWYAGRYYESAKLPFHPNNTRIVADLLAGAVRSRISPLVKLVITDLDDTLWGGVVGDDGWEGLILESAGEGLHYLRLQRFLLGLKENGVMLAIASKNDRQNALEVFRKRREMILRESDFSIMKIDWLPKSENIKSILNDLNLTSSAIVFLDDNPRERHEVRTAFPEILVPELPEKPSERVIALEQTGWFEALGGNGLNRTEHCRREEHRKKELGLAGGLENFLASLGLQLRPLPLENNRDRVVELINKTNQFNLTTRRRGWAAVEKILNQGGLGVCFRLEDRFGDYGVISVIIAVPDGAETYLMDTWVMSCRAMGRMVEHAIMAYFSEHCKNLGIRNLLGEYIPTPKNGPVSCIFQSLGFKAKNQSGQSVFWELETASHGLSAKPSHVEILERAD